MTLSRNKQVLRTFNTQTGSQTVPGISNVLVDITLVAELAATAHPELHELTISGIYTSTVESALARLVVHIGRTSTHPDDQDAGVRTRDFAGNPNGLPFVFRIKALRLNPGDQLGIFTFVAVEEDASSVHRHTVSVKDAFVLGPFQRR